MPSARRSDAAERDVREIAFRIALEELRPRVAERVIDELIGQAERLAQLSSTTVSGTAAPGIEAGVRLFSHKRWVIIFR
ncbi:MAG: hypothetical protein R6U98_33000 [Pirellulaceae bacterium]